MIKFKTISLLMLTILISATSCCGMDEPATQDLETCQGKVTSIDMDKAVIVVSETVNRTFAITPDVQIFKDTSNEIADIKLSDLKIGDYVTVEFYENSAGLVKTVSVTVEYE